MVTKEKAKINKTVRELRDYLVHNSPSLDTERLKFLLQTYKDTDGEPDVMRRAKLFSDFLCGKDIYIDENPIAGTVSRFRAGVQPHPEIACRWMRKQTEFSCHLGGITHTSEDRRLINEAVDYWEKRCILSRTKKIFADVHNGEIDPDRIAKAALWTEAPVTQPIGKINLDYGKVLTKGIKGIIAEAKEELAELPVGTWESHPKRYFLNAVIMCLEAVTAFASRYASLAREMAQKETDPERKLQLEEIAETCEWVPANPARSFYEALQSYWFAHVAAHIENQAVGIVPGRFSQYMYPFYKKDKEEGKLAEEDAIELLEFLFIKHLELGIFRSAIDFKGVSGMTDQNFSLGGVTANGDDATNELDWLLLETQLRLRVPEPTLSILYHDKMSEAFLLKAAEIIRETGLGQPAFHNNDISILRHLYHHPGISIEEARDFCIVPCVGTKISHAADGLWEAYINMAKFMELALNNGQDPLSGWRIGPETGEAESFGSYDEFHDAVWQQIRYFVPLAREINRIGYSLTAEYLPLPFHSALVDDCIKAGKDVMAGGARYGNSGLDLLSMIDLANSLAAIKKVVFEEKRITMKELKEALEADFKGKEEIQRILLDAPKYGNDDDYADRIVRDCYDLLWVEIQKTPDLFGRPPRTDPYSVSTHFLFGERTGALPSGRKGGIALTDASVSAMPGTDREGPTALVRSAARALDTIKYGGNHFNMKFHPSALEGREGLRNLIALVKTYMDLGGHHVQFNCVSGETLRDAQLNPENYRDLVVRVAGFSAFFIHLEKGVQEEIIKRTEVRFE
jgi:formate C-acetyltransferase